MAPTPFNFWDTPLGRQMQGLPPNPPPLWKPVYQPKQSISEPDGSAAPPSQPINRQYLLSKESAYYLAAIYAAAVTEQPFEGSLISTPGYAIEYILNWTDTSTGKPVPYSMNAGMLAWYYCPADGISSPGAVRNPDIVVAECTAAINAARLDALRQVR